MADTAPVDVRLYDANGQHTGGMTVDEEPNREGTIESGGKTYVWSQRNNQWREASGTAKGNFQKLEAEDATPTGQTPQKSGESAPKGEVMGTNVAGAGERTK